LQFSRRAALAAFLLTTANAIVLSAVGAAENNTAALVAKPVALPDMVLGSATAPITIVEYFSLTCSHCAAFAENVFPMLQSKYIDTGKVRFVSREFPLETKAAAASMLARCAAGGDPSKYVDATTMLFKQQQDLIERTTETLTVIGDKFGMSRAAVESCVKDDAVLDKLQADQNFAYRELKVDATPTFFINGKKMSGELPIDELRKIIDPMIPAAKK